MVKKLPLLAEGSVKDILGIRDRSPYIFNYSDRYSIFDWGEMPDHLYQKGDSLAFLAKFFFDFLGDSKNWKTWKCSIELSEQEKIFLKQLKLTGVLHHCRNDQVESQQISVEPVDVVRPKSESKLIDGKKTVHWDYSFYRSRPTKTLVPLEVIFRFGVPKGSSLLKRTQSLEGLRELHLKVAPKTGDKFEDPIIEISSKLETSDRYINHSEAMTIAGLRDLEFQNMIILTKLISLRLKDIFLEVGIELWDGKLEYAFAEDQDGVRELMIVDSIGPDELRLTYGGMSFSKENLRQFYYHSSWKKAVDKSKDLALSRGETNWKKICMEEFKEFPKKLKSSELKSMEMMYRSLANTLSQKFYKKDIFKDAWTLKQLKESLTEKKAQILILGSGGREHALADKLSKSSLVEEIHVLPGNPGMLKTPKIKRINLELQWENVHTSLTKNLYELVIIGPEKLLIEGFADKIERLGVPVIGPSARAAMLEGSKVMSKNFMKKYKIPTADFKHFTSSEEALLYLDHCRVTDFGIVIKASELAGGKGVVVTKNLAEAKSTINNFMNNKKYLVKTKDILIEQCLKGRELSLFILCDENNYKILGYVSDYKRIFDENKGPNTGGMGAYITRNWPTTSLKNSIEEQVILPTLDGMKEEGTPFKGVLFIGLMISNDDEINVIEYNVRFGDPETQVLLPLLENDLYSLLASAAKGELDTHPELKLKDEEAVHVIVSSKGYPAKERASRMLLDQSIDLPKMIPSSSMIYFSGVESNKQNQLINSSGRVLGVTSCRSNIKSAREEVYHILKEIHFEGFHYRTDIGLIYDEF